MPQVVDVVKIPVLAAGGIGDARLPRRLRVGRDRHPDGTRFMVTTEFDLNGWGRDRLLAMLETDTIVTRAMTGAAVHA